MNSVPKIIIGTSGQVATALRNSLEKQNVKTWSTSRKPNPNDSTQFFLDLADPISIENFFFLFHQKNSAATDVYLPGALTHVDRCEQEQELCKELNINGPVRIAEQCEKYGHKLCYYSSEYVFGEAEYHGGKIGPFSEEDAPAPSSYYGKSKLEAEKAITSILHNKPPIIIRTTMVFSYDSNGMNFVMQVIRHLERWESGQRDQVFRVPVDQISTPTYAPALADASISLMERNEKGVWNIVGKDLLSRKDFIDKIIHAFSFKKESLGAFQYLQTKELRQTARRPLTAGLSVHKAEEAKVKIFNLEQAFQEFKKKMLS